MRNRPLRAAIQRVALVILSLLAAWGASSIWSATKLDKKTAAEGLREALGTATGRAVGMLGLVDGYLGNELVRIPMPEKMERLTRTMHRVGMSKKVEEFEVSMNRAAESAAPLAKEVFLDAIKQMTIENAIKIVRGDQHEATDYLQTTSRPKLQELFKPIVSERMNAVGTTRAFSAMVDSTSSLPFVNRPVIDLDAYVTDKALEGMFFMIAKEEEKIRKDPLARTTDLLKTVFGSKQKTPWWKKLTSDAGATDGS